MYFIISIGAILAMLAVAFGAMGAHALKQLLDPQALAVFKTAANYQMTHAIAMILVALAMPQTKYQKLLKISAWLFMLGIILFSGSLYLITIFDFKQLGMITPFGGALFMLAWLLFALVFLLNKR